MIPIQRFQDFFNVVDNRRLHTFGGLVEQQHLRTRRERSGDRKNLLLAPTQCFGEEVGTGRENREFVEDIVHCLSFVLAAGGRRNANVLGNGESGKDVAPLRDVAEACARPLGGRGGQLATIELDVTTLGDDEAHDVFQERTLADAVAAEQGDHLTFANLYADVANNEGRVVAPSSVRYP